MKRKIFPWVLSLFAFLLPSMARAASFDCGKAATAVEKLICLDAPLSKHDEILAEEFRSRRQSLGKDAADALLDEQRSWLRRRDKQCPTPKEIIPEYVDRVWGDRETMEAVWCLDDMYMDRIAGFYIKPIELLYSANDKLCKPFVRALNRHHKAHPREFSFLGSKIGVQNRGQSPILTYSDPGFPRKEVRDGE